MTLSLISAGPNTETWLVPDSDLPEFRRHFLGRISNSVQRRVGYVVTVWIGEAA